jgi:hypothetical protein
MTVGNSPIKVMPSRRARTTALPHYPAVRDWLGADY